MPVGIQILNARRQEPNPRITFIKPLPGPDESVSREFLERIAAQCLPIMRDQHLSVTSLEEYAPNREFVGRNFNGGEVIQLVLRVRGSGRWLPFPYVQMVMMHELAHCRHMNHSRAFWAVRDAFAAEMRRLWAAHYTGEGMWGRGARLGTAGARGPPAYERNMASTTDGADGMLLEHLCGGTYRSRGPKKRKPALSYRERKERRIRRKFGDGGVALGDDLAERAAQAQPRTQQQQLLLPGASALPAADKKGVATRPRVAKSKRGRDLRAAAALVRLEQTKKETTLEADRRFKDDDEDEDERAAIKREEDPDFLDWSESDGNDDDITGPDAVDLDGARLLDSHGQGMVRVCEGDGGGTDDGDDARRELRELLQTTMTGWDEGKGQKEECGASSAQKRRPPEETPSETTKTAKTTTQKTETPARLPTIRIHKREANVNAGAEKLPKREPDDNDDDVVVLSANPALPAPSVPPAPPPKGCPLCSFDSGPRAVTCALCGHVLAENAVRGAWRCQSAACRSSSGGPQYLNAGDCGVCGVCGTRRADAGY